MARPAGDRRAEHQRPARPGSPLAMPVGSAEQDDGRDPAQAARWAGPESAPTKKSTRSSSATVSETASRPVQSHRFSCRCRAFEACRSSAPPMTTIRQPSSRKRPIKVFQWAIGHRFAAVPAPRWTAISGAPEPNRPAWSRSASVASSEVIGSRLSRVVVAAPERLTSTRGLDARKRVSFPFHALRRRWLMRARSRSAGWTSTITGPSVGRPRRSSSESRESTS